VDRAIANINTTWSGPTTFEGQAYTVQCQITGCLRAASDRPNPNANQIEVVQTRKPTRVTGDADPANTIPYGEAPSYQHSTEDDDGGRGQPHEFGHAIGLRDEYQEGPRNADGTRSVVQTGPPGGLMGYRDAGARPTPGNFRDLITGNGLLPHNDRYGGPKAPR